MAFYMYVSLNISYSLSNPFGSIAQLLLMNFWINMATEPGGGGGGVLPYMGYIGMCIQLPKYYEECFRCFTEHSVANKLTEQALCQEIDV